VFHLRFLFRLDKMSIATKLPHDWQKKYNQMCCDTVDTLIKELEKLHTFIQRGLVSTKLEMEKCFLGLIKFILCERMVS